MKIVCLGDSITYGHKLVDPARESYPARLRQLAHGRWQVLNLGINGATVLGKGDIPIIKQEVYNQALHANPDFVVIMLGTNDTKNVNWKYLQEFEKDYRAMITDLRSQPSRPHLILCSIPPILIDYPNGLKAARQQQVNMLLRRVAAQAGVDYLDISATMANMPSFFVDGIHPNGLGAKQIAALVFSQISSL